MKTKRLAISMGDPRGIGPEITLKALAAQLKVEDNWANMFLNQKQEEEVFSNCDVWKFSTRLKSEIKDRQQDSRILEIEGLGYNNLRCVNEIIKKIDEYSGGKIKILIKTDAEGLVTNGGLRNGPDKLHILAHNK